MTSHGVPRSSTTGAISDSARRDESDKIKAYLGLVDVVLKQRYSDYSLASLERTSELLLKNPDYYTVWNIRRRILQHQIAEFTRQSQDERKQPDLSVQQLLQGDLKFLVPLLRKSPKSYWIWNHRVWLLEQASTILPPDVALKFWQEEFALVGKMLSMDNRNFHGWGYRRRVVAEMAKLLTDTGQTDRAKSLSTVELDYTTKMIAGNLSNFSAWHNRTCTILNMLTEQSASNEERKKRLEEELEFLHQALIDPYDQSLWFYHQNLMCTFDPDRAAHSMAPSLTNSERLAYVRREIGDIKDILDEVDDCRWIYQALIDCTLLAGKLEGSVLNEDKRNIKQWLVTLDKLDPLRKGRWIALHHTLERTFGPATE